MKVILSTPENEKIRQEGGLFVFISGPDGTRTRDLRRDRAAF
jgi:hypothetical protein